MEMLNVKASLPTEDFRPLIYRCSEAILSQLKLWEQMVSGIKLPVSPMSRLLCTARKLLVLFGSSYFYADFIQVHLSNGTAINLSPSMLQVY